MSIERVGQGLETMNEILRRPALDPDPDRQDWGVHGEALDALVATVETEVLGPMNEALAELEADAEQVEKVRGVVADRVGDAAGLLLAAQRREPAQRLLYAASSVAPPGPVANLLAAGLADPERFVLVIRAWWLVHQGRREDAVKVAQAAAADAPSTIVDAVHAILDAPKPIGSPPALFGINGFGLRVYGSRNERPDGSYVTTRFITALFVPLLPVDAYRVISAGDQGWYFLGKEPLGAIARWWRRLALVGVAVAVLGTLVSNHYDSPSYRLAQAIEAAEEAEAAAGPDGRAAVLDRYEAILLEFPDASARQLQPVIEAFVRLAAAEVASPLTVGRLAEAKRVVLRYRALPESARGALLAGPMIEQLERWADELGMAGHDEILGGLELLGHAEALAAPADVTRIRDRRNALNRALAAGLAEQWPLEAIRQYASMPDDPESIAAAGALLAALPEGPSIWIELAPTLARWQPAASRLPDLATTVELVVERVATARAQVEDAERLALLEQPELEALTAAVAASPGDQELAVALADLKLGEGDAEGALAVLTAIGPPGTMVLAAQAALAAGYADAGREEEADALLERVLTSRLPAFESAQRIYGERAEALSDRLIAQAQKGDLPAGIMGKLQRAPESEQPKIFGEWLDEQLERDAELSRLREEYMALTGVVGIAIQWGTLKLRRANAAEGEQRQQLLDGAERAFLAIAREGSGIPSYHLGLGQVYYRLGKEEEGERELRSLLDDDPAEVRLAVASVYRELGLVARGREVAEQVYESAQSPVKDAAAQLIAVMASDREESRQWLERADQSSPTVRLRLLQHDAQEALEKGDYAEADAKFAEVAKGWSDEAAHDGTASNNAALAILARYGCTGSAVRLREAVALLDEARSLTPDNALVVGNLGAAVELQASVELLEAWLRPELLLPSASDVQDLVGALSTGPHGPELRKAMGRSPTLRRALDVVQQSQVLGPKDAQPYITLLLWHARRADDDAIAKLQRTLEGVEVDLARAHAATQEYVSGSDDATSIETAEQRLAHYDHVQTVVDRRGDRATQAALDWLRGDVLHHLAVLRGDASVAEQAARAFASGHARWEGLDTEDQARALVEVALLRAKDESTALAEAYEQHRRRLGGEGLLAWLLHDDGEALAALRTRPELQQALALRRGLETERLRPFDWLLVRVGGDADRDGELLAASRSSIDRPQVRAQYEVGAKLSPDPEGLRLVLQLMDAAK